jgi:hypothetical protein
MTDRELLQQVLKFLDDLGRNHWGDRPGLVAALRERLAQPEQEPVGMRWRWPGYAWVYTEEIRSDLAGNPEKELLYTTPPAAADQEPYGWVQPNPSFNSGIFNQGAECPSGWVGSAIAVHTAPPAAQPAQQELVGREAYMAIREARENASEDAYFAARPEHDKDLNRLMFRSGFYRGYPNTPPAAQPAQQEPVAEVLLKKTGGNVGIATVIHEIYSHYREPLRPGDKLYTTPPAAPVQEPVAWMHTMIDDVVIGHRPADLNRHPDRWKPLVYTNTTPLAQAAERNKLASWMIAKGYATGHGDTMEGLLEELRWQVRESEREACLTCYSPDDTAQDWADKIRARGQAS